MMTKTTVTMTTDDGDVDNDGEGCEVLEIFVVTMHPGIRRILRLRPTGEMDINHTAAGVLFASAQEPYLHRIVLVVEA